MAKPFFAFSSSDYSKIVKTTTFVDKTLLIKDIIDSREVVLIAAPPHFGKSTNLNMLKRFLEIEVYEDGKVVSKVNFTAEPVTDTNNYKIFMENKLKITENKTIMNEYFGKTPVIYVDYKCANIVRTFDEAMEFCKYVIHNSYKQHKYLLYSRRLSHHQKLLFERWYNDSSYKELSKQHVAHGLRVLSVHLHRHFYQRKVFVLIDDHDSIIEKSMFDVQSGEVLRKIIALSVSMMSTAVKNNDLYVKGGLITGVSDIPVFGFSDLNRINTYKFLERHKFFNYYGLTKEEVEVLFKKPEFNLSPQAVKDVNLAYNGYQDEKGTKIFNIYSVLRFLKSGEVRNYWTKFATVKQFKRVFKVPAFKQYIDKLMNGKSVSIAVLEKVTVEDIIDLRNLLLRPQSQINYWPATLFNFLLKQGYLTYMPRKHLSAGVSIKKTTVKIPNMEVQEFLEKLK